MSLYAAQPTRFVRQVVTDVLFLLIVVGAVWLAMTVHDAVIGLAGPADDVEGAGTDLAGGLGDAGSFLGGVPLVGDEVAVPFDEAAAAATTMADAGADAAMAVERLAFWLAIVVAALPIVLIAFQYLPGRIGFVREATALRRFGSGPADLDLLALRALTRQPASSLRAVGDDVAARWREGDPQTVAALAALELRACGVRPPAAAPEPIRTRPESTGGPR